jgi:hypothetical protein
MKFNCGVKRHHYSMFKVGRSMLDVHLLIFINHQTIITVKTFL